MDVIKSPSRIHPLLATAAVAVTLVSLVGVAAITGLLPNSNSAVTPAQIVSASADTSQNNPQPASNTRQTQTPARNMESPVPAVAAICNNCGEVSAIRAVQHTPKASGVGVVAGAVLGGILGNQIGSGNGRTLATVAGAGAGGYAGNEVEKNSRTTTSYVVEVRMDNGKIRSFPQSGEGWRVGDQVRVLNGHLTSRG